MARQKKEQQSTKSIPKPAPKSTARLSEKRLYALIIFVFSGALYFNTLFNGFNLDDTLVTQNHRVTSKGWEVLKLNFDAFNSVELKDSSFGQKLKYFMPEVFRVPYYQDNAGFKYEYRPMVLASFALENAFFGKKEIVNGVEVEIDNATISHLINILLYALLCTLLFYVLCMLFKGYHIIFSFIVALLFVAYPMHTEVVASIKNRDEILALIFGLLSLRFSLVYVNKNKTAMLVWVSLFFILGILSKPTTIIFAMLIPLCMVMFTDSGYLKLLLLSTVLIIPAVFLSRLYSSVQQAELALLLFTAISTLYFIKKRTVLWTEIKTALKNTYNYFASRTHAEMQNPTQVDFGFLKNPATVIALLFLILVPVLISVFGISIYNSWLACVPLLVLAILFVVVKDEVKVVLTTPLVLVALFSLVKFFPQSKLIETATIVFLGSQIFSGQKYFRIIGLLNYLLYCVVSVTILHSFHFIFLFLFIGLFNRKFFIASIVAIALSSILFFKKLMGLFHGHGTVFDEFFLLPVIYVFVLLVWKNWWKQAVSSAAVLIPIFLILYFTVIHPGVNNNAYRALQRTYYHVNSIKAVDPTPIQAQRPLNYPEYSLSYSDPFALRFGTGMEVLGKYLQMTFIPYPMSFYYGYSCITPQSISETPPLISLFIHLILAGIAIYFFRKIPILSFSILFYLISVAVFSNLVSPIPGMIANRFLLIPSIGFCIFLAYIFVLVFKQGFEDDNVKLASIKRPVQVLLGLILVTYSGLTFSRNRDWKDSLTLFRHDIKVVDNSAQAHNLLAVHLFLVASKEKEAMLQKPLLEEAIPHFKRAIEIYPKFLNASYDLGRAYEALQRVNRAQGQTAEVEHCGDEALAQYEYTVKLDTNFALPYFNMATILQNKGLYAEAVPMYQKFLTQYPKQLEAYTNLSFAYFKLNDFEKSIATNRTAIRATGAPLFPTINIAKTFMVMNLPDSALIYWEQADAMKPNDAVIKETIEKLKEQK